MSKRSVLSLRWQRGPFVTAVRPWYLWILVGVVWTCTACALRPTAATSPTLPEVKAVTFSGNHHFASRALRKVLATTPRPFWPPWKRGEPYNPPTLEADVARVKKFYFDRGFLDTEVTIGQVVEDAAQRATAQPGGKTGDVLVGVRPIPRQIRGRTAQGGPGPRFRLTHAFAKNG